MNFIEAVKALKEGKCKGIRRISWNDNNSCIYSHEGFLYAGDVISENVSCVNNVIAEDWELINPVKEYEEVEIVRHLWILEDGREASIHEINVKPADESTKVVELRGNYKREIKPKVKIRKEFANIGEIKNCSWSIPDTTRLFIEWEE